MGMILLMGLIILTALYGVFRKLDKSEGPQWLFKLVSYALMPFTTLVVAFGIIVTVLLMFVSNVSGTIWEYSKSRLA